MIRPIAVKYLEEYKANVTFNNGESGIIDFSFLFVGRKAFEKIKNKALFRTIRIAEDGMCIEWANDIDMCPDETYEQFKIQNGLE